MTVNEDPGAPGVRSTPMHIVAIGWLYVVLMMALTENSLTASVLSIIFYGLAPLGLLLWLLGTPERRRRSAREAVDEEVDKVDRADAGTDQ